MIPILLSIPSKLKTLIDRVTISRMEKIDEITPARMNRLDDSISSRAPASTALSTATWTSGRAQALDQVTSARMSNLDASVSSRAPASTALSTATWTNGRAAALDLIANGVPSFKVQRGSFSAAGTATITPINTSKSFIISVSKGSAGYVAATGSMSIATGWGPSGSQYVQNSVQSISGGTTDLTVKLYSAVITNSTTVTADGPCEWQIIESF